MQSEVNQTSKNVGSVPGSLVRYEFAVDSKARLIKYNRQQYDDNHLEGTEAICSQLGLPNYAPRQRSASEFIVAAPLPKASVPVAVAEDADSSVAAEEKSKVVTWINIDGLGDIDLLKAIGKKYQLHALALEDVVNVDQRAKTDAYDSNIFIVLRMAQGIQPFRTEQVSMFLLEGILLSLQEYPGDCLDPVRTRIAGSKGRIRQRGADYLAYSVIDAIIDGYFPILEKYDEVLRSIADEIDENPPHNIPKRLHLIRADLLNLRKIAQQHEDAVSELIRDEGELIGERTQPYLRDCLDHIHRLVEMADTYRETCGELRELYFALLGQRTNDVVKVLTIIATIFIPMSFVAGVYGMNFDSNVSTLNMPELQWAFGYPFAITVMLSTGGGILFYLRRKGWL